MLPPLNERDSNLLAWFLAVLVVIGIVGGCISSL